MILGAEGLENVNVKLVDSSQGEFWLYKYLQLATEDTVEVAKPPT